MQKHNNDAELIDRALQSIAIHEKDEKLLATARKLILSDLEHIREGEKAFHAQVAQATCEIIIRFGCVFSTAKMEGQSEPGADTHPAAPNTAMAAARRPIAWGGGHCWYIGRCYVCIEWVCHG